MKSHLPSWTCVVRKFFEIFLNCLTKIRCIKTIFQLMESFICLQQINKNIRGVVLLSHKRFYMHISDNSEHPVNSNHLPMTQRTYVAGQVRQLKNCEPPPKAHVYMHSCTLSESGVLSTRLTGAISHFLLLSGPLKHVSFHQQQHMRCTHNGTRPHFLCNVIQQLNQAFGEQWIGCRGQPAHFPDFNLSDFWLRVHLKIGVFSIHQ